MGFMKQDRVALRETDFELNSFHCSAMVVYCRAKKFFIFPQLFKIKGERFSPMDKSLSSG